MNREIRDLSECPVPVPIVIGKEGHNKQSLTEM